MMKTMIIPAITALMLTTNVQAFDDNKEGFILGLGIGASSIKTDIVGGDSRDSALATSLKLGYGLNEQLTVYLGAIGDAYKYDGKGKSVNTALTGIGIDYYFDANKPYYVTGMIGASTITDLQKSKDQTGYGFLVGAGYEITDHVTLQADYMKINTNDTLNADTDAIRFTVNYTWY